VKTLQICTIGREGKIKKRRRGREMKSIILKRHIDWTSVAVFFCFLVMFLFANLIPDAFAVTAPSGGFAQDVYDVGVTKVLKGPIGFVAGVAAIVFGATMAIQGKVMSAAPAVLGGAVLLKADSIVESLGCII